MQIEYIIGIAETRGLEAAMATARAAQDPVLIRWVDARMKSSNRPKKKKRQKQEPPHTRLLRILGKSKNGLDAAKAALAKIALAHGAQGPEVAVAIARATEDRALIRFAEQRGGKPKEVQKSKGIQGAKLVSYVDLRPNGGRKVIRNTGKTQRRRDSGAHAQSLRNRARRAEENRRRANKGGSGRKGG